MNKYIDLTARVLLAHLFVLAGISKLGAGYEATQGYMAAMGVPGLLLPLVMLLEIGGGLALIVGLFARPVAFLLAGFSVVSALIFHNKIGDQIQLIMLMKNFAIAGGLLLVVRHGAGALSLDALRHAP